MNNSNRYWSLRTFVGFLGIFSGAVLLFGAKGISAILESILFKVYFPSGDVSTVGRPFESAVQEITASVLIIAALVYIISVIIVILCRIPSINRDLQPSLFPNMDRILLWSLPVFLWAVFDSRHFILSRRSPRYHCVGNLSQIDGAIEQWGIENKATNGTPLSMEDLIGSDKYIKNLPVCPDGGIYSVKRTGFPAICSNLEHKRIWLKRLREKEAENSVQ